MELTHRLVPKFPPLNGPNTSTRLSQPFHVASRGVLGRGRIRVPRRGCTPPRLGVDRLGVTSPTMGSVAWTVSSRLVERAPLAGWRVEMLSVGLAGYHAQKLLLQP